MTFQELRSRIDPKYSDAELRAAMERVAQRGLETTEKYVRAQLNLSLFAKTLRA